MLHLSPRTCFLILKSLYKISFLRYQFVFYPYSPSQTIRKAEKQRSNKMKFTPLVFGLMAAGTVSAKDRNKKHFKKE
jgi:hypothetical protein